MNRYSAIAGLLLLVSRPSWAAEELPGLGPIVLQLLFVLAMIGVCTWLVRRTPLARRSGKGLAVKESLPLGAKDRLVVVRFEDRELLIGINGNSMTLLSERDGVPDAVDGDEVEHSGRSFLELLGQRS